MTEWDARDYNRQSTLQQVMADEALATLKLRGDERVLDLGCGDGKITAAIAKQVPQGSVLGVDPSRDMVQFSQREFGAPKIANLTFDVADARHLTYDQEFDLLVSFNALHWVPEQAEALAGIHRALKPQGRAMLRFVSQGTRESLEDVIEEVRKQPRWAPSFEGYRQPYAHFTPDAYRQMSEAAGLRVLQLDVMDKAWDFQSREGFTAWARATFVEWTRKLAESEREAFIAEVLDRYARVASTGPQDAHTFKFYQMQIKLERAG
jgi:trans-aconitate methyltransferase